MTAVTDAKPFLKGTSESTLPTLFHLGKQLGNHHSELHVRCIRSNTGFKYHTSQAFSKMLWINVLVEGLLKVILFV